MNRFGFVVLLLAIVFSPPTVAQQWTMSAAEWSLPRSGDRLLDFPQLHQLMQAFITQRNSIITITYPGGDEGILWAEELKGWFVALGVENSRIELVPGSAVADMITLGIQQ